MPPGFELQLFAAEPLITGNPEAMAWDERGRLWIAETKDYPNNLQPAGQGHDVIKILEDTNHDGRADKATIFADKLSIVSSLVFVNGGIIVSQAGELVALKDTNGDDKADVREVADDRMERARHPRARVEPEIRPRQLDLGRRRLLRIQRHGRRTGR